MAEKTNDKMNIWNAVCKTDEEFLKKVELGSRKFHAINPQYTLRAATELWGPLGKDWHIEHEIVTETMNDLIMLVKVFYPGCAHPVYGYGCEYTKTGHASNESHKKAFTDGFTKAMSYLGFSADVFLGEWDDVKYTQPQREPINPDSTEPQDVPLCPIHNIPMKLRTNKSGHQFWSCSQKIGTGWCKETVEFEKPKSDNGAQEAPPRDSVLKQIRTVISNLRKELKWSDHDLLAKAQEWNADTTTTEGLQVIIKNLERETAEMKATKKSKVEQEAEQDGLPF